MTGQYFSSAQADKFLGRCTHHLRNLRCLDYKRAADGLAPLGPKFYKEAGKRSSTKAVIYKREDLIAWLVTRTAEEMLSRG